MKFGKCVERSEEEFLHEDRDDCGGQWFDACELVRQGCEDMATSFDQCDFGAESADCQQIGYTCTGAALETTMDTNYARPIRLLERDDTPLHASDAVRGLGRTEGARSTPSQAAGEALRDYGGGVTRRTTTQGVTQGVNNPGGPSVYRITSGVATGNDLRADLLEEPTVLPDRMACYDPPPKFDGTEPRHWLSMAGHYYDLMGYSEERKVHAAVQRLEGKALKYWCSVEYGDRELLPTNWDEFEKFMLERFSGQTVGTTIRRLQMIRYKGDVDEVAEQFADILAEGDSPPANVLKSIFLSIFPLQMVMGVLRAQPKTWIQARNMLRQQVGLDDELALEWYSYACDERRNEVINNPIINREGWVPLRGFRREPQALRGQRRVESALGSVRAATQQDYRTRRNSGLEQRALGTGQNLIKCYGCGGEGHRARECPNGRLETRRDGQRCRRCGGIGHWATACPTQVNYEANASKESAGKEAKHEVLTAKRQGNGKV